MGNKKNYQNENVKRMMEIYNRQKDSRVKKTKNILGKIRKAARNVIITVLSAGTVVGVNAALDSSESARADLQSTTSSPEAGGTNNILWSSSQEKCGFCVKNGQENYELVKGSAVKEAYNAAKKAGATGGTALNGRGLETDKIIKFLGISIEPEKEIEVNDEQQ